MTPVALAASPGVLSLLQVVGFLLVVVVLWKFVKPFLVKILGERTQEFEKSFGDLERDTAETSRKLEELKGRLAKAGEESKRRLDKAMQEAGKARERLLSEAAAQGAADLERARVEIQTERDKAILELRQETAELTLKAAGHVIRSAMTDESHNKMVDKYLADLESVERT